ncbi:ComF family protein [Citricoccus sp. GCM10030269]|uniref:ComF family protein n=1 Tax=Citricoccus sp. GCM10030269 TaxID=3273388 RepID=UPI003618C98B
MASRSTLANPANPTSPVTSGRSTPGRSTSQGWAAGLDHVRQWAAWRGLSSAGRELAGVLMPSTCVICAQRDGTVCSDCEPGLAAELLHPFRAELHAAALPLMEPASVALSPSQPDTPPAPQPVPVVAAARYDAGTSSALLAFKDHGRVPVARFLRPAVHRALAAAPELLGERGPFTVVPIPGRGSGFRRRGYDPVDELLSGPWPPGWDLDRRLLTHRRTPLGPASRSRTSHSGTGSAQRRRHNADRFQTTAHATGHQGRNVVLFDDVMTTGSTLAAAWRAVERGGIRPVGAVVLAAVTAPAATDAEGLNSG